MVYFQTKNSTLGIFLGGGGGFRLENVDIFFGHLEHLTGILDIL
jgi:hypothetical protein